MEQKLCRQCVNFTSIKSGIYDCDFEYWTNLSYSDAIIECGNNYDCEEFEDMDKIKGK